MRIGYFVRLVEYETNFVRPQFHKSHERPFEFIEHCQRRHDDHARFDLFQIPRSVDPHIEFILPLQEGFPRHFDGIGRCDNHDVADVFEAAKIFAELVCHGCFSGSLLPVQQEIAFLEGDVHILLLERQERTFFQLLVVEMLSGDIPREGFLRHHLFERSALSLKLPLLATYDLSRLLVLLPEFRIHPSTRIRQGAVFGNQPV